MQHIKQAWVAGNTLTIIKFTKGCCLGPKASAGIYTAFSPVLRKDYIIVNFLRN